MWVITGDGDALSIGGNHLLHALRRNVNITIILFNNQIYGLTKGQYSPTSEAGKVTKSTPFGSLDYPYNPVSLALGAEASFVARTHDMDRKHMTEIFRRAYEHKGAALVEVYQNCNVFNDGAFETITAKDSRASMLVPLEHGKPVRFGPRAKKVSLSRTTGARSSSTSPMWARSGSWSMTSPGPTPVWLFPFPGWPPAPIRRPLSACSGPCSGRTTGLWPRTNWWPPLPAKAPATWPGYCAPAPPGRSNSPVSSAVFLLGARRRNAGQSQLV